MNTGKCMATWAFVGTESDRRTVTSGLPVTRPGRSITSGLVDERGLSLKRSSVKRFLFGAQRFRRRYPACPQSGNECCDKR